MYSLGNSTSRCNMANDRFIKRGLYLKIRKESNFPLLSIRLEIPPYVRSNVFSLQSHGKTVSTHLPLGSSPLYL